MHEFLIKLKEFFRQSCDIRITNYQSLRRRLVKIQQPRSQEFFPCKFRAGPGNEVENSAEYSAADVPR